MTETNSRVRAKTWPFERYKPFEKQLHNAASRWFSSKGFKTQLKRPYCLKSFDEWPENIIYSDVVDYIKMERERCKGNESFLLHKYLHHRLSSQAMIFNLIGPLIVRNDIEPLKIIIKELGMSWPSGKVTFGFEYNDREVFNEDSGQPTSLDVFITGKKITSLLNQSL